MLPNEQRFAQWMERVINYGRDYQCYMESVMTHGNARLPRKLKKSIKKYMKHNQIRSMLVTPAGRLVLVKDNGNLYVCHTKY